MAEIVEHYRRLGHAQVHVQPTVTEVSRPEAPGAEAARVTPQLVIDEGVPTTIGSIAFGGSTDPVDADLRGGGSGKAGPTLLWPADQRGSRRRPLALFERWL